MKFISLKQSAMCVCVAILIHQACIAQGANANWCFGDSAGLKFVGVNTPTNFKSGALSKGETATISDANGNLLFYAFGIATNADPCLEVHDNSFQQMQNGDSLIGDTWYQTEVILPMPGNDSLYYLFSSQGGSYNGVFYSIISKKDISKTGKVLQKNNQIYEARIADYIQTVKHGNGRDWWLITHLGGTIPSDTFYVWLIDPSGITGPFKQNIGFNTVEDFRKVCFNSTGTKFTEVSYQGIINEFDFDRCTGTISNQRIIRYPNNVLVLYPYVPVFWSVAYSHNDNYLYVSNLGRYSDSTNIYQLDMSLTNPWASRDTIWEYPSKSSAGMIRLAPDHKIYVSMWYIWDSLQFPFPYPDSVFVTQNTYLGVINSPDSPSTSCNFQPFSYYLGGARTYIGTSNLPDYNLGPLVGSGCDTLSLPNPSQGGALGTVSAYIHQEWQTIFVNAQNLKGQNVTISVYDGQGSLKFEVESLKSVGGYFTQNINAANWPAGLYLIELKTEKEKIACKVVKY